MRLDLKMKKNNSQPNFFVVGAPKSGTSSLSHYLRQHPDVYVSPIKEPFFFAKDIREEDFSADYRGRAALDMDAFLRHEPLPTKHIAHIADQSQYLELFREVRNEKAVGELSTGYLYSSRAAEEIFKFNPSSKIVMVLRNPVERAYSHYQMHIRDFMQFDYDFINALEEDVHTAEKGWGRSHLYVELGLYYDQVRRYLDWFPQRQVKVFLYEELVRNPAHFMKELYTFLEVDPALAPALDYSERKNGALYPKLKVGKLLGMPVNLIRNSLVRHMPAAVKDLIRATLFSARKLPRLERHQFEHAVKYFEADIRKLSALLNRDLESWLHWRAVGSAPVADRSQLKVLVVTNMYPSYGDESWRGVFIKNQINTLSTLFPGVHFDILHIKGGVSKGGRKINYVSGLWRFLTMIDRSRCDIIWAHHSLCVLLAFMRKKIPLLYSLHEGQGRNSFFSLVGRAEKLSDHVLYVNKGAFEASGHANKYFCPSGVDTGKFCCLDRAECRLKLGLDPGKYYVFFPASPKRPEKNAAFAYSFAGKYKSWLERENIEFVFGGGVESESMPIWMNAMDCMVSFSDYESDGMVFKEAMACNLPVITFDVGNARIYFGDGIAGSIIGRDYEALQERLAHWKGRGRSKGRDFLLALGMDARSVAHQVKQIFEKIVNGKN